MIKFLLYSFLFYVIFRYLFGGLMKAKTVHYHQTNHYHNNPNERTQEPGKVTVDPKVSKQKQNRDNKLGEYVDFEEVKE